MPRFVCPSWLGKGILFLPDQGGIAMTVLEMLQQDDWPRLVSSVERMNDINALDEQGWSLLHWAAGQGKSDLARLLLERGADIFCFTRDKRTPYLVALAAGHGELAAFLAACEESRGGDSGALSSRQGDRRIY